MRSRCSPSTCAWTDISYRFKSISLWNAKSDFSYTWQVAASTGATETAFASATTITRRGSQEHIYNVYQSACKAEPSTPTCLELGTVSRQMRWRLFINMIQCCSKMLWLLPPAPKRLWNRKSEVSYIGQDVYVRSGNITPLLSTTSETFIGSCGEFACSRWSIETNSSSLNEAMLIPDEFHVLSAKEAFHRSTSITVFWQSWKLMEKHTLRSVFSVTIPWVRRSGTKRMLSSATHARCVSQEVNTV